MRTVHVEKSTSHSWAEQQKPFHLLPSPHMLLLASPGTQVALVVGKKRTIAAEKRQKKEQKEEAERHMAKQEQLVSAAIAGCRAEVKRRRVGQHLPASASILSVA